MVQWSMMAVGLVLAEGFASMITESDIVAFYVAIAIAAGCGVYALYECVGLLKEVVAAYRH